MNTRKTSRGRLSINLDALRSNYRLLQDKVGQGCRVAAVLKADAYGLGAVTVGRALLEEGCETFFVACLDEALELRAAFKDVRIAILNGFYESEADLFVQHDLIPVLGSFMEVEGYKALGVKHGRALPAFLKFNTRMNRLGFGSVETQEMLSDLSMLDGIDVRCVMSHFACADEVDHPMVQMQFELFNEVAVHFPAAEKSLCNSFGIFRSDEYHFDMVRPGMALYGLNPTPETDNPMQQVINLDLPIIRVRMVYDGAHVGYGATYRFERGSWLATVSAGYADGLHWAQGNEGAFFWKGYKCPIRGRLSMDLTTVDLSVVPEGERPKPGDFLEVIGPHQSAAEFGKSGGGFDYEVLTSLSGRYERIYTKC